MAEHRATMLGGPLRRYEDPARSRDPRIREIVAALATLDPAPAPRAHFRAELRAQLVAVAPRLVEESITEELPAVKAEGETSKQGRGLLSGLRLSRPLAAVAATVVVLAMLLGGAVLVSRNALPGDTLYGIKRASENAQYALAANSSERARLKLTFAGHRLEEVQDLLPGGTGPANVSSHVASLVKSTLSSADSDVMTAAQALGEQAVQNNSAKPLQAMTSWAPGELNRLSNIINRLPGGPVKDRAKASYTLVSDAYTRASALQAEAGCACLHGTTSDKLGPVPCPVCDSSPTPTPNNPGSGGIVPGGTVPGNGSASSAASGNGQSGGGLGVTNVPSNPGGGTNSAQPTTPAVPLPSVSLPGLPSASLGPIGIGSCGIHISLSPININLGTCKPSHS